MARDINTFQDLVDHGENTTVEDFIVKAPITIKHRAVISAQKTVRFDGYTFKKGWTGGDTTADEYTLTAITNASGSASGHARLTMTIEDVKRIPRPGTTVEVRTTGSEYDGTWQVLAYSEGASNDTRQIVIAKAYNASASPAPSFTNAKIRAASLEFHGHIVSPDWWRQLFSGFNPGDVRGSFGYIHEVYPEWWGLETDAGKTDVQGGRHDRAINCAIRSVEAGSPRYSPAPFESFLAAIVGRVVALAPRTYYVSAPLDLSGVSSQLRGAGAARTVIQSAETWGDDINVWIDCSVWPHVGERPTSGNPSPNLRNHAAMIWIGSGFPDSGQSFFTSVRGVTLKGYSAMRTERAVNGLGRVSGISSKGWVEEHSIVEDVNIEGFTGFGVGFPRRMPLNGKERIATVNGLTLRNFWITSGARRDCYPLYFTIHAAVVTVQDGTIDCGQSNKGASPKWQQGVKALGVLQALGYPENGDEVTIDTTTYIWQGTPVAAGDIKIASPASNDYKAGVHYGRFTPPHPGVRATFVPASGGNPARIDLKAATVGEAWNTYPLKTNSTSTTNPAFVVFEPAATLVNGLATAKAVSVLKFTINNNPTNPANGSWIEIGDVRYTFWSSANFTADRSYIQHGTVDVLIRDTAAHTLETLAAAIECYETQKSFENLLLAINGTGTDGVHYKIGGGKIPHPDFFADAPRATQAIGCPLQSVPQQGDSITVGGQTLSIANTLNSAGQVARRENGGTTLPGTSFAGAGPSNATAPHALVYGTASSNTLTVEARNVGEAGNDITVSATGANSAWSGTGRLSGGTPSTKAAAILTMTSGQNAPNGSSVSIGGRQYIFRSTQQLLEGDGDVLIGSTGANTLQNLSRALSGAGQVTLLNLNSALNRSDSPDNGKYIETTAPLPVTATYIADHTILLTAKSYFLDGNDITLAASGSVFLIGGPFLEGGTRLKEITIHARTAGATFNGKPLECVPASSDAPAVWTTESTVGGADVPTGGDVPDLILETVHTGIYAQGEHLNLNNIHIEGVTIGVNVVQSYARSHVTIANLTSSHSNDSRQAYNWDPEGVDLPEPTLARQAATHAPLAIGYTPHYWNYSCAVLISRTPLETPGHENGLDSVTITGLSARDDCRYLIRDAAYNVELTSWRQGRNVAHGSVAFYARGNTTMPAAGVAPYAAYAGGFPYNTDAKVYFIGPV